METIFPYGVVALDDKQICSRKILILNLNCIKIGTNVKINFAIQENLKIQKF